MALGVYVPQRGSIPIWDTDMYLPTVSRGRNASTDTPSSVSAAMSKDSQIDDYVDRQTVKREGVEVPLDNKSFSRLSPQKSLNEGRQLIFKFRNIDHCVERSEDIPSDVSVPNGAYDAVAIDGIQCRPYPPDRRGERTHLKEADSSSCVYDKALLSKSLLGMGRELELGQQGTETGTGTIKLSKSLLGMGRELELGQQGPETGTGTIKESGIKAVGGMLQSTGTGRTSQHTSISLTASVEASPSSVGGSTPPLVEGQQVTHDHTPVPSQSRLPPSADGGKSYATAADVLYESGDSTLQVSRPVEAEVNACAGSGARKLDGTIQDDDSSHDDIEFVKTTLQELMVQGEKEKDKEGRDEAQSGEANGSMFSFPRYGSQPVHSMLEENASDEDYSASTTGTLDLTPPDRGFFSWFYPASNV